MSNETAERQKRSNSQIAQNCQSNTASESTGEDFSDLVSEVSSSCQRYCTRRPRVVAGAIFGLGFMLGWKMRPW